jgi:hypothetical protein
MLRSGQEIARRKGQSDVRGKSPAVCAVTPSHVVLLTRSASQQDRPNAVTFMPPAVFCSLELKDSTWG